MLYSLFVVALTLGATSAAFDQAEEDRALAFLNYFNKEVLQKDYQSNEASWKHATNLTEYNKKIKTQENVKFTLFMQDVRKNASKFDVEKLSADSKRQIKLIKSSASPKSQDDVTKLSNMESEMESIYSEGSVTDPANETIQLYLDPELTNIMRTSRDYDRLLFAWKGWRDAVGPKLRPIYKKFVDLSNKGAKDNGWDDKGVYWRSWYEVDDLESDVEGLYNDLKPLYEELHAYVRFKLRQKYPGKFGEKDPIPAHLFGNMWSQSWINIYDLIEPYKGQPSLDVTPNMVKQKYTPLKMVQLAESFFTSIGLKKLPQSFYDKSLIEKPSDGRNVICHASAWDFGINKDVR